MPEETSFIVELDCGADAPITFKMSPEELREHAEIPGGSVPKDNDPRRRAQIAGDQRVLGFVTQNLEEPVSVVEGDSIWIIPTGAIRSIRLRDPDAAPESRPFGFVKG